VQVITVYLNKLNIRPVNICSLHTVLKFPLYNNVIRMYIMALYSIDISTDKTSQALFSLFISKHNVSYDNLSKEQLSTCSALLRARSLDNSALLCSSSKSSSSCAILASRRLFSSRRAALAHKDTDSQHAALSSDFTHVHSSHHWQYIPGHRHFITFTVMPDTGIRRHSLYSSYSPLNTYISHAS